MKRAFTLVELLVTMAILSCLAGLLYPAILAAREAARSAECRNNLHEIGVDMQIMAIDFDGVVESIHQYRICPSHAAEVAPEEPLPYQSSFWVGFKRLHILEETQLPSERIVIVVDPTKCHPAGSYALFLDGHVTAVQEGDYR